jgi:tetratricopeptide (TPR) repeat protein
MVDIERGIEIADSINSIESARAYGNLASGLSDMGELQRSFEMVEEARRHAERFGLSDWLLWLRGESAYPFYYSGDWDESIRVLDELMDEFAGHPFWMEIPCRQLRGHMRLARGDEAGAREDGERALELAREAKDPQVMLPSLSFAALVAVRTDPERAAALLKELLTQWKAQGFTRSSEVSWTTDAAVVLSLVDRQEAYLSAISETTVNSPWRRAAVEYLSGDPAAAAEIYAEIGAGPDEAYARLRAAELLLREGRRADADLELERAMAFWRKAGATAYLREGEALLAEAS